MTPDDPAEVIGNLPRSRPTRANPRREAARAKAATAPAAGAKAKPKAKAAPAKAKPKSGTAKVKAVKKTAPAAKVAAKERAAATAPHAKTIPPAGYAVPGSARGNDPADAIADALRGVGTLVQTGAGVLRGLLGR